MSAVKAPKFVEVEGLATLHLLPRDIRQNMPVSPWSRWGDKRWHMERDLPGSERKGVTLDWGVPLPDGRLLTDDEHGQILEEFRILVWSLRFDRRYGKRLKPASLLDAYIGLGTLAPWMVRNGYHSIAALSVDAAREYLDDIVEEAGERLADPERTQVFGREHFLRRLKIWSYLYTQRSALVDAGIQAISEPPFGGRSNVSIADELAERSLSKIPPLPDEVAMPILAAAIRMLAAPADDVIAAVNLMAVAKSEKCEASHSAQRDAVNRTLRGVVFSELSPGSGPWRGPLEGTIVYRRKPEAGPQHLNAVLALRSLVSDVRDAAVVVLQGLVGLRINEVCSIEGGWNPVLDLPNCIEIESSLDGLSDLYYVRGLLTKGRSTPEPSRWLLGSTPRSIRRSDPSFELPLPVRAICTLQKLFAPWRTETQRRLILSFTRNGFPRTARGVAAVNSDLLREGLKNFVLNYVDLSGLSDSSRYGEDLKPYRTSAGTIIRTHQWRKNFAHYVLLTRPNLLQAVSQHFKHMSLAMTEQGYIVQDPFLRGMLGEAATDSTVDFFHRASTGEDFGGRLGELVNEHRNELEALIRSASKPKEAIRRWVATHDLRIFFTDYGLCGVRLKPTEANCHRRAGTSSWRSRSPNHSLREPSTCAGCACFGVDSQTAPFWEGRRTTNLEIYAEAEAKGLAHEYTVVLRRIEQSTKILNAINRKAA